MITSFLPRALSGLLLAAGIVACSSGTAHAQTVEGVEAGRLREAAKAQQKDASTFAAEVVRRGEALRDDALRTRQAAMANRARAPAVPARPSAGVFDFDKLVADADIARAGPGKSVGPRFIAFASMSMPVASLRALVVDVTKAGGVVVFRGFQNNSVKAFGAAMVKIVDRKQKTDAIGIDPRLFRAFGIKAVPAYVVTTTDFDLCDGFSCTTQLPPHDRLAGNVTTEYALDRFATGGGPGAAASRIYLARLRKASK